MALRFLRYLVRIWDWWLSQQPEAERVGLKLPAIFPMVLAQRESPWRQPVDFASLVDIPESLEALFAKYFPQFSYWVYDVTEQDDAMLREQAMFGLVVLLLKYARQPDLWHRLAGWVQLMKEVQQAKDGLSALKAMFRYVLSVSRQAPSAEVLDHIARHVHSEVQEDIVTYAQQLREQGKQEGREEMREEMRAQAQQMRAREEQRLRTMLQIKFSTLTAEAEQRISNASLDQLDAWTIALLQVDTLEALFTEHAEDQTP